MTTPFFLCGCGGAATTTVATMGTKLLVCQECKDDFEDEKARRLASDVDPEALEASNGADA